jgi:hypothetical protein
VSDPFHTDLLELLFERAELLDRARQVDVQIGSLLFIAAHEGKALPIPRVARLVRYDWRTGKRLTRQQTLCTSVERCE